MIDGLKINMKSLRWMEVFPLTKKTSHFYSADFGWQTETGESR
jgi:hypothetical protein